MPASSQARSSSPLLVTAIRYHRELLGSQHFLGFLSHRRQLPVAADVANVMRDNQVVFGLHGALHVIAHDPRAAAVYRAGMRVGQGQLLVRCLKYPDLELL